MQETENRSEEHLTPSSVFCIPSPVSSSVPPSPWELEGAAIIFIHNWRSVLALVHYDSSPVGPYEEVAIATLTLRGPTVTEMVVNSKASLIGGRRGWGFPKVLGELGWERRENRVVFRTDRRKYRVKIGRLAVPVQFSGWCWQVLDGRHVRVPVRVRGKLRIAWQGRRVGVFVESLVLGVLRPEAEKE